VTQAIESLPSKGKVLSSNPFITQKKDYSLHFGEEIDCGMMSVIIIRKFGSRNFKYVVSTCGFLNWLAKVKCL
jgi:hypothetical protein